MTNPVNYKGEEWDISHLAERTFKHTLDDKQKTELDVIIVFSCHCYSHSFRWDQRSRDEIPRDEILTTETEQRVLSLERYELSKTLLLEKIEGLSTQKITVASEGGNQNFLTFKESDSDEDETVYIVFFKVERIKSKKILIFIQSAYKRTLTKREKSNKSVRFNILIKAVYEGRSIRA